MGLFSIDGPLARYLNVLADLVILNIFTVVLLTPFFCLLLLLSGFIPLNFLSIAFSACTVFCGAPVCALHYCMIRKVREEEGSLPRDYFRACKENFKQGNLLWTGILLAFFVLYMDMQIAAAQGDGMIFTVLQVICGAMLLLVFFLLLYAFPLQARFVNPLKATVKNALLISVYVFPRTIAQAVLFLMFPFLYYILGFGFFPVLLLFGFSVPVYLRAKLYVPVFSRFEEDGPKEDSSSL